MIDDDEYLSDTVESDGTGRRVKPPSPIALQVQRIRGSATYKKTLERFRERCASQRNSDGSRGAPCAICGGGINYRVRHPHPDSWSADHIVPMSQRPDLALDANNLQASHLGCNSSKRDGEDVLAPGALGVASEDW